MATFWSRATAEGDESRRLYAGALLEFERNALTGPRYLDVDASMIKRRRIKERMSVEFRAEFFNVFNNPNSDVPAGNTFVFNDTSLGRLTVTQGNGRLGQLTLKLSF